jgi:hypothetical protein
MTIAFENDKDVIVYDFEKIIAFARAKQFLFMANSVWWIAGVLGLDSELISYIDNLEARKAIIDIRAISRIPRDIARGVSPGKLTLDYTPEPLRRTRKGRINPLPQSKRSLKKDRKDKRREEAQKSKDLVSAATLAKIRASIIQNLSKE